MYKYATGLDQAAVDKAFGFAGLDTLVSRSEPFDDALPSAPTEGAPNFLYSLAFISTAYQKDPAEFHADAKRIAEYEASATFFASDTVNIKELVTMLKITVDEKATAFAFVNSITELTDDQFKKLYSVNDEELKAVKEVTYADVKATGADMDKISLNDNDVDTEAETLTPIIIAEMETGIKELSVGEAVMQMELADEAVLIFKNESHNRLNVVYKRKDGNIGWIDPLNMK